MLRANRWRLQRRALWNVDEMYAHRSAVGRDPIVRRTRWEMERDMSSIPPTHKRKNFRNAYGPVGTPLHRPVLPIPWKRLEVKTKSPNCRPAELTTRLPAFRYLPRFLHTHRTPLLTFTIEPTLRAPTTAATPNLAATLRTSLLTISDAPGLSFEPGLL